MNIQWQGIILAIVVYMASSWLMLVGAGESQLTAGADFFYWLVVTASTVGYGDLSPTTALGKVIVTFYVIPLGLSLFALTLGRVAAFMSYQWHKGIQGFKTLNHNEHILILGWDAVRTPRLIKLMLREQEDAQQHKDIVLCVVEEMENPLPEYIGFIKARCFNDDEDMDRACIEKASCIIIDNATDDVTMTAALYAYSRNPEAHTIAFLKDENLGRLLKKHCPSVEYTPSVAVEMLAKAAMDPGSSMLHHQLLNVEEGMTQYSIQYPAVAPSSKVEALFVAFKAHYDATLIGVSAVNHQDIIINPGFEHVIEAGATIYYIADERIRNINWDLLHAK